MTHVSDIKLIRTDTTLDLSQKAEKGMICLVSKKFLYCLSSPALSHFQQCGAKVLADAMSLTTKHLFANDSDRKLYYSAMNVQTTGSRKNLYT